MKKDEAFFLDILDIDDYISKLNLPEIATSSIYAKNSSEPNPEGLLSYQIFGMPASPVSILQGTAVAFLEKQQGLYKQLCSKILSLHTEVVFLLPMPWF